MILFLTIIVLFTNVFPQGEDSHQGKKAFNFKGTDLDGKSIELNKLLGKGPTLVSFWATWCKPCMEELDEYQKIYSEFKDKGFNFIAISTDNEKTIAKVKPFVKSKQFSFTVITDSNSEIARKYYAYQIPYSLIIDKTGTIIYSHTGFMKGDEKKVKNIIENLLAN
ncbi:MAG: TlpA disulfide reductase family protein [Ignavibacteria bacterium]|nr:TlpA disulfide reductase family protein [Ignavibacteria bacterium]MDP3831626.1 TlpA disulfide reductase family protein [Ignavibacteriaceae bacterium]